MKKFPVGALKLILLHESKMTWNWVVRLDRSMVEKIMADRILHP